MDPLLAEGQQQQLQQLQQQGVLDIEAPSVGSAMGVESSGVAAAVGQHRQLLQQQPQGQQSQEQQQQQQQQGQQQPPQEQQAPQEQQPRPQHAAAQAHTVVAVPVAVCPRSSSGGSVPDPQ